MDAHRPIRTFGRTGGRALSERQKRLIAETLPPIRVPKTDEGSLAPQSLFQSTQEVWLEIGFGGAEHLAEQASRFPKVGFIGCEPFTEGVAKALAEIETRSLSNIRLHPDDAREPIRWFAQHSLDRVFILFPDPWPKRKQRKRRLVQPDFVDLIHSRCRVGAKLRFATDVASYADEALQCFLSHGGFDWTAECADDWRCPPTDHVTTRYESKQLGDCAPVWFDLEVTASGVSTA